MTPRTRRTLGLFAITIGLLIYCIAAMIILSAILPIHWVIDLALYIIAGIVWIFPAYWVMKKTNG